MAVKISLVLICVVLVKITEAELTGMIIGGMKSKLKDFPHSVFLHINTRHKQAICGASILNQALLLTAAHCVNSCHEGPCIRAFTSSERKFKGFVSNVISFKIHEEYDELSKTSDIALLRLQANLRLGKMVKRIIIMKNPPKYKTAYVAGWGRVSHAEGSSSFVLKHAKQTILNRKACEATLNEIPVGTFCGQGRSYPHRGDSGGAFVIKQQTIQIGIVSFKKPNRSDNTEVYTDVSYYYNWILINARKLYCKEEVKQIGRLPVKPKKSPS